MSTTLRVLSGLPNAAPSLSNKGLGLVLVDIQNTYREGVMQLKNIEAAVSEAQSLLERARKAGIPVFHIRHSAGAGSPYDVDADNGQICKEVAPQGDEVVITKTHPNSFFNTTLEEELKKAGVTDIVIAGAMSHMCISSTARGAFNNGFGSTVVASACATRDLTAPDGSVVPAQELHNSSLAAIADLFAVVVPTAKDLKD